MQRFGLLLLGKKGLISLRALKKNDLLENLSFVVVGEDASIQNDYFAGIKNFCDSNGIRWLKRQEFSEKNFRCNYLVAIGWRWLVNTDQYKLITIHDSILPKYRGFNPLVTALIEGDKTIGVTAIFANEEIDAGDIIAQESVKIHYPILIQEVIDKISQLYAKIIVKIFLFDDISPKPQNHSVATYSLWRNEDDYRIDWSWDAKRIVRFIDAVGYPYLGALTTYKKMDIRIFHATEVPDLNLINRKAGKIFQIKNNVPTVVCGNGMVQIKKAEFDKSREDVTFDKLRVRLQ